MALSGSILPIHPNPFGGEALSSWLTRGAVYHHQLPSAFFKSLSCQSELFKQDIDMRCPRDVILDLSTKFGVPPEQIYNTTLESIFTHVYLHSPGSSALPRWVGPSLIRRHTPHHFGLKICPMCLSDRPFIRLLWRCTFLTSCHEHRIRMIDRCEVCGHPKSSRKIYPEHQKCFPKDALCYCHNCGWDYRLGQCHSVSLTEIEATNRAFNWLNGEFNSDDPDGVVFTHLFFEGWRLIMNGLARLASGAFLVNDCPIDLPAIPPEKRAELEFLSIDKFARLMEISYLLLRDWPNRFVSFSKSNNLGKGFWARPRENVPYWFYSILKSHLDLKKYSVSGEEIEEAVERLVQQGLPVRAKDVIKTLGLKSRPSSLSSYLARPAVLEADIDRIMIWLARNQNWGNLGRFVACRTRLYLGIKLVSTSAHDKLCRISFENDLTKRENFNRMISTIEFREGVPLKQMQSIRNWYDDYFSERRSLESKFGLQSLLFVTSSGRPMSVTLALKSIERFTVFLEE